MNGGKQSIIGFYNPIPPCLPIEHENPMLCVIYKKTIVSEDSNEKVEEIEIKYFRET